jgi:hypothetical protein
MTCVAQSRAEGARERWLSRAENGLSISGS